ncbi:hypothetical protein CV102_17725 [Natronococcus pandeyae]|uniref:Uncharacterized protein n=1 Tax=Natronococcus pandeyae TaxID=2055836 RepID=A0A8J8PZQ5_9EURY|nr:hypothetical protein CV102_17725 [Natronococcus pandeyae]
MCDVYYGIGIAEWVDSSMGRFLDVVSFTEMLVNHIICVLKTFESRTFSIRIIPIPSSTTSRFNKA